MAQNMYRVGDYVYFEISSAAPFQVRRIEELNKTATGNVEAKVMCFYRRRDISPALLKIADDASPDDKSAKKLSPNATPKPGDEENKVENGENTTGERADSISPKPMHVDEGNDEDKQDDAKKDDDKDENQGEAGLPHDTEPLTKIQRHLLRELYLSRQIETLPATHIRGKCVVTLLSEVETPDSYLGRDDAFFYSLVFDPQAKTLLADKGEIRVGEKYQSRVAVWDGDGPTKEDEEMDTASPPADGEKSGRIVSVPVTIRETLVYHPFHNLTDRDIDQFLIVARAVGTFSRALDTSSSVKLPSLHMTAAAASRDVTLLHAMALLHHANYDLGQAMKFLVPPPSKAHYPLDADKTTSHNTVSLGGPILCRDQMEEWSAAEANLFEEAIEKYGKDFNDIRQDFLPWKALKDIVEYYYMWKTTNRYVDSKRTKAAEAESRLKQVYIPNYNKPNPNLVGPPNPSGQPQKGTTPCESCRADMSAQWYAWGPAHLQMRLCAECWTSWKKNGGLKRRHQYETYDKSGAKSNTGVAASTDTLNTTGITRGAPMASHQNRSGTANTLAKHGAAMGTGMGGRGGSAGLTNSSAVGSGGGPLNLHAQKPRVAFFLHTTLITRIARRLAPKSLLNVRKCARRPFVQVQGQAIKQHCQTRDPSDIMRVARTLRGGRLEPGILQALREQHQQQQHPTQAQSPALPTPISATGGALKRPLANGDKSSPSAPPAKKLAAVPGLASSHHHHISRSAAVVPPSPIVSHSAGVITSARGGGDGLPDSRWMSTTDTNDRILFLAGPQLKKTRRALCAHRDARRAILSPCTHHPALERGLAKLNSLMCG